MAGKFIGAAMMALALAINATPALAAPAPKPDPQAERADALVRKAIADRRIPGLQIAVVRQGKVVLLRNYGLANLQTPVPVTDETVFSINSITKAFTGVAAMQEVEAGRLDLGKPIGAYVEGLPEAWRGVTVRQLLSHTSGLPDYTRKTKGMDEAAAWTATLAQPVYFAPGERYDYNQTNYALIQRAINGLHGRPLDDAVIGPQIALAGMTRTRFGDSRDVIPGKAAGYSYRYATPTSPGVLRAGYEEFSPMHYSASGLNSTASDMARWMTAILDGRMLKPDTLKAMWTPAAYSNGKLGQWGMGWIVQDRPRHRAVGMTGGSRAAMFLYPEDGVGIVILTNLAGGTPEDLMDEIAAIYIPGMKLTGVAALRAALDKQGFDDPAAVLAGLRREDPAFKPDEHELNDWGYRLLGFGKPKQALAVLRIGAELYPDSGNAFDSLADAWEVNGDREQAIRGYRRALELDPKNANAAKRLKALEAGKGSGG